MIIDPEATRSRILLYFYGFINVGSITGMIAMVYAVRLPDLWPLEVASGDEANAST